MNLLSNDINTNELNNIHDNLQLLDNNVNNNNTNSISNTTNTTTTTTTDNNNNNHNNINNSNNNNANNSNDNNSTNNDNNDNNDNRGHNLNMPSLQTSDKSLSNEINKDTIVTTSTKINNIHTGISDNSHTFTYPAKTIHSNNIANNIANNIDKQNSISNDNSTKENNNSDNNNSDNSSNDNNTNDADTNNDNDNLMTANQDTTNNNLNPNTDINQNNSSNISTFNGTNNDNLTTTTTIDNNNNNNNNNIQNLTTESAPMKKKRNIRLDGAFRFYIRYNAKINIMNLRLIQKKKRLNASQYLQMFAILPTDNKRYYCQFFNENILCNQSITVKDPKDAAKKCRKHIVDAHGLNAMNDEKILQNFNPLMKTYLNEIFNKEKTENNLNNSKLSQKEKYKLEETYYINQLVGLVATSDSPFTLADNKYMQNIIKHNFPSWKDLVYRRKTKERLTAIVREIKDVINENPNNKFKGLIDLDNIDNGDGRDVSIKRIRRAERVSLRDETLDALKLIKKLDRNFGDKFDINNPSESLLKALEDEIDVDNDDLHENINNIGIPNGLTKTVKFPESKEIDLGLNSLSNNNGNSINNINNNSNGIMNHSNTNNLNHPNSSNNMNLNMNMNLNQMYRTGIDSVDNENQYIAHLNENDINAAQFMSNRSFINNTNNKNNINNNENNSGKINNAINSNDNETISANTMNAINNMINTAMIQQKPTQLNHLNQQQQQQPQQQQPQNINSSNIIGISHNHNTNHSNNNPNQISSQQLLSNNMSNSLQQNVQQSLQQSLQRSIETIRNNGNTGTANTGASVTINNASNGNNHSGMSVNNSVNATINNDPLQQNGLYNSMMYNTNQNSYNNNDNNVNGTI